MPGRAPAKIAAEQLQAAILSVVRSHDCGLTIEDVRRGLRRQNPAIDETNLDLRISANLTSLVKRGEVERKKQKWARAQAHYYPVYSSNDTSVEELSAAIVAVLEECGYDCFVQDVVRLLGERALKYQAIPERRVKASLRRLVEAGKALSLEALHVEGEGEMYGLPIDDCPAAISPEIVAAVNAVVPVVSDRRRTSICVSADVEANGFPRLFRSRPARPTPSAPPIEYHELRWRQRRSPDGAWRLVRVRFPSQILTTRWGKAHPDELHVRASSWSETPPGYR